MPVVTSNMVDLKDETFTKINEKYNDFKIAKIAELREQIKQEVPEAFFQGRTGIHCLYASGIYKKIIRNK